MSQESMPQFPGADDLDFTQKMDSMPDDLLQPLEADSEDQESIEALRELFQNIEASFDDKSPEEKEAALTQLSMRVEKIDGSDEEKELAQEIRQFIQMHLQ